MAYMIYIIFMRIYLISNYTREHPDDAPDNHVLFRLLDYLFNFNSYGFEFQERKGT